MIFNYYILKNTFIPMLLSGVVFMVIPILNDVFLFILPVASLSDNPFLTLINFVGLTSVNTLSFVIPISFLIGVFVCLNRLSLQSEIIAIRTSAISLFQIYRPIFAFSLGLTILLFALNFYISPISNFKIQNMEIELFLKGGTGNLKKQKPNVVGESVVFFEDNYEGNKLHNLTLMPLKNPQNDSIISAEDGWLEYLATSRSMNFKLVNGNIISGLDSEDFFSTKFSVMNIPLKFFPINITERTLERARLEKGSVNEMNNRNTSALNINELFFLRNHFADKDKNLFNYYLSAIHFRIISSISPIVVGLFALALSIVKPRDTSKKNYLFLICFLIFYTYFQSVLLSLITKGSIEPFVIYVENAMWIALGILLVFEQQNGYFARWRVQLKNK